MKKVFFYLASMVNMNCLSNLFDSYKCSPSKYLYAQFLRVLASNTCINTCTKAGLFYFLSKFCLFVFVQLAVDQSLVTATLKHFPLILVLIPGLKRSLDYFSVLLSFVFTLRELASSRIQILSYLFPDCRSCFQFLICIEY